MSLNVQMPHSLFRIFPSKIRIKRSRAVWLRFVRQPLPQLFFYSVMILVILLGLCSTTGWIAIQYPISTPVLLIICSVLAVISCLRNGSLLFVIAPAAILLCLIGKVDGLIPLLVCMLCYRASTVINKAPLHARFDRWRYLTMLVSNLLFLAGSWLLAICLISYVRQIPFVYNLWNGIIAYILPLSVMQNLTLLAEQPWLSVGISLLTGCLLIIAWAKDKPCPSWNPFSAAELGLSERAYMLSLTGLVWLLCGIAAGSYRLSLLLFLGLLASNVTVGIYCHTMHGSSAIQIHVIDFLLPQLEHKQTSYKELADSMYRIVHAVLKNMREESRLRQTEDFFSLIKRMIELLPEKDITKMDLGVTMGFSCMARVFDSYIEKKEIIYYFRHLYSRLYDLSRYYEKEVEDGNERKEFVLYILWGLLLGALKAGDTERGRKAEWWNSIQYGNNDIYNKDGIFNMLSSKAIGSEECHATAFSNYLRELSFTMQSNIIAKQLPQNNPSMIENKRMRALFADADPDLRVPDKAI